MAQHRVELIRNSAAVRGFNRVWGLVTNSPDPLTTFRKTMREPVKIGPFTATVKGIAAAFTMLGPLVHGVVLSLVAFGGVVSGAALALGGLGIAAAAGFGQALVGIGLAIKPVIDDFKVLTQTGDAYSKAVLKYGEGSKQAAKAQDQMNSALKGAAPLARQAVTDFEAAKISFGKLTGPTRQAMSGVLADGMKTFRAVAPSFARNTNTAARGLQSGLANYTSKVRLDEAGGNGAYSTMFQNAAAATQPLVTGIGNVTMALAKVGASASRFIGPLATQFQNWSENLFGKSLNTAKVDGAMNSLMADLKSVGRLFMAAGRWAKDLLNSSREAGRSLTDSLTGKFQQWDRAISSPGGRKKLTDWFKSAAGLMKNLGNTITPLISAIAEWSRALTPVASVMFRLSSGLASVVGFALKLPIVSQAIQTLGMALAVVGTASWITNSAMFGPMIAGAGKAVTALSEMLVASRAVTAAIVAIEIAAPRAGLALSAIVGSTTLLAGAIGVAVVGMGLLVYGLQKAIGGNKFDELNKQLDETIAKLSVAADKAKSFEQSLGGKFERRDMAQQGLDVAKANEISTRGTKEHAQALRDLNRAYAEYETATAAVKHPVKDLDKQATDMFNGAKTGLDKLHGSQAYKTLFLSDGVGGKLPGLDTKSITELQTMLTAQKKAAAATPGNYAGSDENMRIKMLETELTLRKRLQEATRISSRAPAVVARAKAGLGVDNQQMLASLGNLGRVGGKALSVQVGLKFRAQSDVTKVSDAAVRAIQRGATAKEIKVAMSAKGGTQGVIDAIAKIKPGKPVKVGTRADTSTAQNDIDAWVKAQNDNPKTITVKVKKEGGAEGGAFAEGGVISAASGYTKQTAYGSATRRPPRRAMGVHREPTFLVGEENRTEYVIATNPAYRAANIGYLLAAAAELKVPLGITPAAGGTGPRKVLLNAILNEGIDDKDPRGKKFVNQVKGKAKQFHMYEDWAAAYQTMMGNDEKRNQAGLWASHRNSRLSYLTKLLRMYKSASSVGSRANKAKLAGMIAQTEGDILEARAAQFAGGDTATKDAQIEQLNAQLQSAKNAAAINAVFAQTAGGFMNSGGFVASGGPTRYGRAAGSQTFVIQTLHPGDPNTLAAIGNAAVAGIGYQGYTSSPRATI
jgi:hypothetical protein